MFCIKCGTQIPDNARFCTKCGLPVGGQQAEIASQPAFTEAEPMPMPMKWFKFLIYFGLFAGAVINLVTGLLTVTGMTYEISTPGVTAKMVYSYYGNDLKLLDTVYGIVLILLAVFGIVVRFRLAGYKKDGPGLLYTVYGVSAAVGLTYAIIVSVLTGVTLDASGFSGIITSVAMIFVNYTYFKKRSHLFVK